MKLFRPTRIPDAELNHERQEIHFICSPYRADHPTRQIINRKRAERYCRQVILEGHIPFAPHVFFTRFLDEAIPLERRLGINAGLRMMEFCQRVRVFCAPGSETPGMQEEIKRAKELGIEVQYDRPL